MKAKPVGLYVHIPFCLKKCNYCDFCSFAELEASQREAYITRLKEEIKSYKRDEKIPLDTIFFGGGTPSLLTLDEFNSICGEIENTFRFADNVEFTIEANPKTLTREKLDAYVSRGVNRISIGMQTIHENELKILGRVHSFSDFEEAYQLVVSAGIKNVNVDLMYGIPEQTLESFKKTVDTVISLKPQHISAYGLILEEGTPFFEIKDKLLLPSEDDEIKMYGYLCSHLKENGYGHYEVSNYARQGYASRHNLKYWRMEEYIGVGLSAYSFFEGERYGNTSSLSEYLSLGTGIRAATEVINKDTEAYEYVMLGLRLSEGISLSEYKERFGRDFTCGREEKIQSYVSLGYATVNDGRLALTDKGLYVSNSILTELL